MTESSQPTVASSKKFAGKKPKSGAKQRRHQHRLDTAQRRRNSTEFIVPMNAMVPIMDIPPSKKRDKIIKELGEDFTGMDMLVPDPRRGTKLTGSALKAALQRRQEQDDKIAKKRTQRRNFRRLSKSERYMHREAGAKHVKPGQLHVEPNKTQDSI